jgi:hypothetical protein
VTLFRSRVFTEIIKVKIKMRSEWIRVCPKLNDSILKREKGQTQKKPMWKWHQRLESKDTWIHQKLEEARKNLPLEPLEGAQSS